MLIMQITSKSTILSPFFSLFQTVNQIDSLSRVAKTTIIWDIWESFFFLLVHTLWNSSVANAQFPNCRQTNHYSVAVCIFKESLSAATFLFHRQLLCGFVFVRLSLIKSYEPNRWNHELWKVTKHLMCQKYVNHIFVMFFFCLLLLFLSSVLFFFYCWFETRLLLGEWVWCNPHWTTGTIRIYIYEYWLHMKKWKAICRPNNTIIDFGSASEYARLMCSVSMSNET